MNQDTLILIALFALGAYIGIQFEKAMAKSRRAEWRRKNPGWKTDKRNKWGDRLIAPKHDAPPPKITDAADQLRTVMRANFTARTLLNKKEAKLFKAVDKWVLEKRPAWQVMAQVSLGEILWSKDKDAYSCINSKRVDLLIVDEECRPLHAIEYQGDGHYEGAHATAARDAVKKEALRRAGIGYVEVNAGDTPAELRRLIERLLKPPRDED